MLNNMSFTKIHSKGNRFGKVPELYREELQQQLLDTNFYREAMLCNILLFIVSGLFLVDMISTSFWTTDNSVFSEFSYVHVILMVIPTLFLVLAHNKRIALKSNFKLYKAMHWALNFLVMHFSMLLSLTSRNIERAPYAFIVAMFCIASIVLLKSKERLIIYTLSYILYVVAYARHGCNINVYLQNLIFVSMLFILAIVISHIQYYSFVNDFVNTKTIIEKNHELDKLYKKAERELMKRTEELNETVEYEKVRAAFFANISHELRTPLTVIFSAEQMIGLIIKEENSNNRKKDIKQYTEIIKQNCYRLIRLVANLIDITKIDAGYFHVNLENCDVVKVVEDITLSVASYIENRDISLIFDTEVEESTLACDPDKIERIILNLLSNAVKFTPKGGSILVNIHDKADRVMIIVRDTGIGIPKDMCESIFERFVQVDKTISRNREGSGIGLSLVKSLVDMHEGSISLISEEGQGSEFIIELPKRILDSKPSVLDNDFMDEKQKVEKINIEFSDIYN
jgi:two-component system, OmpR family, phosphate regulon sensor histidine kinase PhoR